MREYTNRLHEELLGGLRPDNRQRRLSPFFDAARFVEITEYGVEEPRLVLLPITDVPVSYPWPTLLRGEQDTLIGAGTSVRSVNESTWVTTPLATIDPADGSPEVIPSGGVWHHADMGASWFLFNGECVVFRTGLEKMGSDPVLTYAYTGDAVPNTGCHHRGRIVVGGFSAGSPAWPANWQAIFTAWKADNPVGLDIPINDLSENWVLWSSVGGGDFPLWLFYPQGFTYDLSPTVEDILRRLKRNEWGIMPMHFQGQVLKLLPLDREILVFGTDGVSMLRLANSTYGREKLLTVGIADRGAADGRDQTALWMDDRGSLWLLRGQQGVQRLGYEDFFQPMLGFNPVVTYDAYNERFFITCSSGAVPSYVLNLKGKRPALTEFPQRLLSVAYIDGAVVGTGTTPAPTNVILSTTGFDLGLRAIKTLTAVNVGYDADIDVYARVDYRYSRTEDWKQGPSIKLNKEGNAVLRTSGVEFRITLTCAMYEGFELDYVDVKWQLVDKRQVRGPFAGQPVADE